MRGWKVRNNLEQEVQEYNGFTGNIVTGHACYGKGYIFTNREIAINVRTGLNYLSNDGVKWHLVEVASS